MIHDSTVHVKVEREQQHIDFNLSFDNGQILDLWTPFPTGDRPVSYEIDETLSLGLFRMNTCKLDAAYFL
ncbi:hypothetical protein [Paenibacillus barengoltzii]|uniref:hypothetical protein n=1 Tax=Paenibacillus barengoltzii TaxID=343517 RepID=UPI0003A6346F